MVRSAAILLVLVSHALIFFFHWSYLQLRELFYITGFLGVELFFVLSGFLIGKIILKEVLADASWPSLRRFYLRRWFRTLPPYFLVVLFLLATGSPFTWQNLFFVQTFQRRSMGFFPVSWSLAIEEWFYLFVPLLLLLVAAGSQPHRRARRVLVTCFVVIGASLTARWFVVRAMNPPFAFGVAHQPPLRMDSLTLGVVLAVLSVHYPRGYEFLASRRRLLFPLALAGIGFTVGYQLFVLYRQFRVDQSVYVRTGFLLVVPVFISLLVVSLESSRSLNRERPRSWWVRSIEFLSVTSYAAYLIHSSIFGSLSQRGAQKENPGLAAGYCVAAFSLTLLASYFFYRLYERPILRLRDRLTASPR